MFIFILHILLSNNNKDTKNQVLVIYIHTNNKYILLVGKRVTAI